MAQHDTFRVANVLGKNAAFVSGHNLPVGNAQFCNNRRRGIRIIEQQLRTEGCNAVYPSEIERAVGCTAMGISVELVALQPVVDRKVPKLSRIRIKTAQSAIGAQPYTSVNVFLHAINDIVRQSVGSSEMLQFFLCIVPAVQSHPCRYPQHSVFAFIHTLHFGYFGETGRRQRQTIQPFLAVRLGSKQAYAFFFPDPEPSGRIGEQHECRQMRDGIPVRVGNDGRKFPRPGIEQIQSVKRADPQHPFLARDNGINVAGNVRRKAAMLYLAGGPVQNLQTSRVHADVHLVLRFVNVDSLHIVGLLIGRQETRPV